MPGRDRARRRSARPARAHHAGSDLAVTSKPAAGHAVAAPLVLIEILSPSNAAKTRANITAYRTIQSPDGQNPIQCVRSRRPSP